MGSALCWRNVVLCTMVGAAVLAPDAAAQAPVPAPPQVLDGPSTAIIGLSQLSIARDGSGGLVYLKQVGGTAHVFVSRLVGGSFQPPEQVDAGFGGPSSQPVIAAGNAGLLVVGFVNGGVLYVVDRPDTLSAYAAPIPLAAGGRNPTVAMTNLGKAYLAFTAPGAGGSDVRCAYYYRGGWALESGPLDAVPSDNAGTGAGRPAVAASGDGVGIVAWGEAGHVFTRRVWGTAPSVVFERADIPSLGGWSEASADQPAIGTGGDSSYAAVAFHEVFTNGSQSQSRVLMAHLRASMYDAVVQPDGLTTPGGEGAVEPQVAVGEYGEGLVTSARDTSNAVVAMRLNGNESPGAIQQVGSLQNLGVPYAIPAAAGFHSGLVAWQQEPGSLGPSEIRVRYYENNSGFQPEQVLSTPSAGPADAADGLDAAGDISADVAVAWVQGVTAKAIVVAQMYQPPGGFGALQSFQYVRSTHVTFAWSPAQGKWGPINYALTVDGIQVARTTNTSAVDPAPLPQGRHTWVVTASNPAGLTRSDRPATVFVDTVPPQVKKVSLRGARVVGSRLRLRLRYTDTPAGITPQQASGIKKVGVKWGDGSGERVHHGRVSHVYRRARRYRIVVTVTDRAGNATKVVIRIKVAAPPHKRRRGHHAHH